MTEKVQRVDIIWVRYSQMLPSFHNHIQRLKEFHGLKNYQEIKKSNTCWSDKIMIKSKGYNQITYPSAKIP